MRGTIGLRGETENFLKETVVTMVRLAEAWLVRPNQAQNTYQKLYGWEEYNAKSRAAIKKEHYGKRKSIKEDEEE